MGSETDRREIDRLLDAYEKSGYRPSGEIPCQLTPRQLGNALGRLDTTLEVQEHRGFRLRALKPAKADRKP